MPNRPWGIMVANCVILCGTLKKEGHAFRNIGKYIPMLCLISLANFRPKLHNLYVDFMFKGE